MIGPRVLFVVDSQNMYYGAKEEFGKEKRISFGRLRSWVYKHYKPRYMNSLACVSLSSGTIQHLVTYLEKTGYEVLWRVSRSCGRNKDERSNTDVDALVSMEVVTRIDDFDTLITASGDGDYIPMYRFARSKGKRVEVACFRKGGFNRDVLAVVDGITFLGEEVIYSYQVRRED